MGFMQGMSLHDSKPDEYLQIVARINILECSKHGISTRTAISRIGKESTDVLESGNRKENLLIIFSMGRTFRSMILKQSLTDI